MTKMMKLEKSLTPGTAPVKALLLSTALVLAGCGQGQSERSAPQTPPVERQQTQAPQPVVDPDTENVQFRAMIDRHAKAVILNSPETATQLGLDEDLAGEGFQARFSDYGFESDQVKKSQNEEFLRDLKGISRDILTPDNRLTYDILRQSYESAARRNQFAFGGARAWGSTGPYRITQLSGIHLSLPRLLQNEQPLKEPADIDAYMSRLAGLTGALDGVGQMILADSDRGVVPPVFALQGATKSMQSFVSQDPEDHVLMEAFESALENIEGLDADARNAYQLRAVEIMGDEVYPAFDRLRATLTTLIDISGTGVGIDRLGEPGEEFYLHALNSYGAQGRTGEEIHELGLAEVARITNEMDAILASEGYTDGSVASRMDAIGKRADNQYPNDDAGRALLLASLREQVAAIMAISGDWFGTLPSQGVEVRRIPVHEQDSAAGGYYTGPSLDGTRPGIYWINLKDTADWPKLSLPTLTYHEAVPGHHFQISLQRAIPDLPLIRNMMGFSEFSEGWALYAEQVAAEMGLYADDPLGNLGRLQSELFRAARLVVDSGLHAKQWSREQSIDYMVNVTGNTRASMTREVERYAVWPGQATSYKLGMLTIGDLRGRAEEALGDQFSIAEFHDEILLGGAMPLPVLERRVNQWIVNKQTG